jgi:putative ABC transport system permease protein
MKTIIVAFRSLFKEGRSNLTKIISLGTGLAVGLVLLAKVYFEQSYDDFFPDAGRIYQIQCSFGQGGADPIEYGQVSGAIAPGMMAEIPEVEAGTRITWLTGSDGTFFSSDRKKYRGMVVLADTCLLDILYRRTLIGDARDVLSRPMYAMVSSEIAQRMGGVETIVGQTIELDNSPGKIITIGGVFEALPLNSHLEYDVLVSMPSIGQFINDGSMNWVGNDRYAGYVRLIPGTAPESLAPAIRRMQENNQPMEQLSEAGVELSYSLLPVTEVYSKSEDVRRMINLLAILAFALIFTAVMNYVLIVISSLVGRAKEMAVNKCYGASAGDIYRKMLAETFADLVAGTLLAGFIIFIFQGTIEDLLGADISALFSFQSAIWLAAVWLVIFFIAGLAPAFLFARIPVAAAFRSYRENKRFWKLGLLFLQITAACFLLTLLVVITRQYNHMIGNSAGFESENLAYCPLRGIEDDARHNAVEEIARLPEVSGATLCMTTLISGLGGNNVSLPGDPRELFNAADLYWVGNGYLELMGIPVVEGRTFTENITSSHEVMVSRDFIDKIIPLTGWTDGVIGKSINVSGHGEDNSNTYTICGVFENVRLGAIGSEDTRPKMLFYNSRRPSTMLIKYHHQTAEANRRVTETLERLFPDKDIVVYSYPGELVSLYVASRRFRDAVLIGSIVTLIITLIGLLGYTKDEINRRRKEVAIRKVNGATLVDILRMFMTDISRIALPAIVIGAGVSAYVANGWQAQFPEKTALSAVLFVTCGVLILLVVLSAVAVYCYRAANANPALSIKSE